MSTISTGTLLTTAFVVNSDLSGTLQIQTGASSANAVYIDASQNVGIGTIPSGTYKLQVNGDISGSKIYTNGRLVFADRILLNDISNQFDGSNSVFNLILDQTNITNSSIQQSVDVEVILSGKRLSPYIKQDTTPWLTPFDSFRGFRVVATSTDAKVIIYNAPAIGDQADITIINTSSTVRTRKYPYSATTIALGD
jgi:hypothetical protein